MNFNTNAFSTFTTKLQAMGSALLVTLVMLGGINSLATSQPSAELVAHVAAGQPS